MSIPLVALMGEKATPYTSYQQGKQNAMQNKLAELELLQAPQKREMESKLAKLGVQQKQQQVDAGALQMDQEKQEMVRTRMSEGARGVLSAPEHLRAQAYKQYVNDLISLGIGDPAKADYDLDDDDMAALMYAAGMGRSADDVFAQPKKSAFQEKLEAYKSDPVAREMVGKSGVQINVGGAKKEQEKLAEARVGRYDSLQQDAMAAMDMNERLTQMEQIDVKTGFGEKFKADAAAALKGLGVEGAEQLLDTNIASVQAFNGVSGDLLIRQMSTQKGPQTDRDAQNIRETLPLIGNEAAANKFIISGFKAINQRKIEQAEFYDDYLSEKETLDGADKAWREYKQSTPLVSDSVKDPATGLPMFFYDFQQKAKAANPGATDEQVAEAWRKMTKGK